MKKLCLILTGWLGIGLAQEKGPTARELFYSVPKAKLPVVALTQPPVQAAIALKCQVLRSTDGKNYSEAKASASFTNGDAVRLMVTPNSEGYLYIFQRGTSGAWEALFPNAEIAQRDNRVVAHKEYRMPPGGAGRWTITGAPGEEKIFVVFARSRVSDLDTEISNIAKSHAVPDALVGRLRAEVRARDLVYESGEGNPARKETALYVADKSGAADSRVVQDITLKHR